MSTHTPHAPINAAIHQHPHLQLSTEPTMPGTPARDVNAPAPQPPQSPTPPQTGTGPTPETTGPQNAMK